MNLGINFFDDLNSEKIDYVVWKNTNLIKQFYEGKENLDIYIHSNHHEKFKYLIKKNNWVEVKSTSNNFTEIKHYLFFESNKILHIHAYFKLYTGNSISKNYDLTNYLNYFENKHFDKEFKIWVLNYNLQLLLFKIRILLKRKSLLGRYLLKREMNLYEEERSNIVLKIENDNNNQNLIINNIDINSENLSFKGYRDSNAFLKSIKNFKRVNLLTSFFHELLFLGNIFIQKIFKLKKFKLSKNTIIFISGADASGKTTIAHNLEILFKKHFKTKKFTIGKPYPTFLIKILIKEKFFKEKKKSNSNNKNNISGYLSLLKNINLAILRYIYSLKIFYFNFNTNIIILDRYLSENIGDINGPRITNNFKDSFLKKFLSTVEVYLYKRSRYVQNEYQINTDLETCLIRNRDRYKDVKKTDEEIIERFKNYLSSEFKSKNKFIINNNLSKQKTITEILNILSKNINENN
jgi:hypothetical protein